MNALYPSPEQIANWQFFSVLILAITTVFFACAWVLDRGIDYAVARWNRRRGATVIHFEERRASLRRAMGGR